MIQLVCTTPQTLKRFTDNNLAQASFCWDYLIQHKEIKINGKKVDADCLLNAGDIISYYMTKKQQERSAFTVLYEDEHILVIDKDSGVNSEAVYAELVRQYGNTCSFIHRLDRNTRGLLTFAKTALAEEQLLLAFQQRRVDKRYLALCFGAFPKTKDTLIGYLKKDEERAQVRVYPQKVANGERIVTEYQVIEKRADGTSLVEIVLHTGKTHQIRAHTAFIGCPVVGDMKYGWSDKNKERQCTRQQLVAKRLSFTFEGELSYLNGIVFESKYSL